MARTDNDIEDLELFHSLDAALPDDRRMNNPFCYEPDELTMKAVTELCRHLPEQPAEGKMWGVLVVEKDGKAGFVNAYSGQLSEADEALVEPVWRGCPAVFDYLSPDGYFKVHEREITAINHDIALLADNPEYLSLKERREELRQTAWRAIADKQRTMREAKEARRKRREEGPLSAGEQAKMTRESQFLKAEVHRAKVHFRELLSSVEGDISIHERKIDALRRRRGMLSDRLQSWLFSQFVLVNALGERKSMPDVFRDYYASSAAVSPSPALSALPGQLMRPHDGQRWFSLPSGSGECCEPKMLQYAYLHGMKPLRIASFWWGPGLGNEVRRQGCFYPACSGRCKPILDWMLRGLDVMANPLEAVAHQNLKIIYEDDYLAVVGKPSGMLSVPGKSRRESVVSVLADRWKGRCVPLVVHRLDMATSGLMVVAKDRRTQRLLRHQFEAREIEKEYEAIVDGTVTPQNIDRETERNKPFQSCLHHGDGNGSAWDGIISLPLSPDLLDRPRQKVDIPDGKEATTLYRILNTSGGETRLRLRPLTGRTHQLRVHCSSPLGLDAPIKGDMLYGKPSRRLFLHACRLSFVHPVLGRRMTFTLPAEF